MRSPRGQAQRDALGLVAGGGVLAAIVAAYALLSFPDIPTLGVAVAPAVTAVVARPFAIYLVGGAATLAVMGMTLAEPSTRGVGTISRTALVAIATYVCARLAGQREHREAKLLEGRTLAQVRAFTALLAGTATPQDVGSLLTRQGRAVLGAETSLVYAVADDHLELLASDGYHPAILDDFRRIPLDASLPINDVIRRGVPLSWTRRAMITDYPALGAPLIASRHILGVPLMLDANPLGVAIFGFHSPDPPAANDRAMAQSMAEQAAQALHRARLYEASVQAEAHVRILQEVTAALADAFTTEAVAEVVLRESTARVQASASVVTLIDPAEPGQLRLAGYEGFPEEVADRWQRFSEDAPIPVGSCLRANDIVAIGTSQEMIARYPLLGDELPPSARGAGIWLPIPGRRGPAGVMAYFFPHECTFDTATRELYSSIASQCGQALERARLLEAEAERSHRVEVAATQARQLDALTAAFSNAITPAEVVASFGAAAVSQLGARSGAMFVLEPSRRGVVLLGKAPVAGTDGLVTSAEEGLATRVATTGLPIFETEAATGEPDDEHHRDAAGSRRASFAMVPMTAFGVTVGALLLRYTEPRPFGDDERTFLLTVGQRCGEALERARLYEAERASRLEAQRSAESLSVLQSATATLTACVTSTEVGRAVLDAALPAVGGLAGLVVVQRHDDVELAAEHNLPGAPHRWGLDQSPHVNEVLATGRAIIVERLSELLPQGGTVRGLLADAGVHSLALLPLRGRDRVVGVLVVGWAESGPLSPKTASVLATFAAVCGQALERSTLFDAEHAIADTLQRSLLPVLPVRLGRLELQGRYRPGTRGTQVGGDWFDAIVLPDDRVCLVVGDVEGRGVRAASTMGQLRAALRALTRATTEPATLLAALNDGLLASGNAMVTMAIAIVDRDGSVSYGYAGHPPIFVRRPDGQVEELTGARSVPLGVVEQASFRTAETKLERGTVLVLYTDGLVERRSESIDAGLQRLADALRPEAASLVALADRVVGLADDQDQSDDIAVLVAGLVAGEERLVFQPLRHLGEVRGMRATLGAWLADQGASEDDVFALTLAVAEAAVNSLQHAYPLTGGSVDVAVELDGDVVRATVADQGAWRSPEATKDGKRGLQLMRGLADVTVTRSAGGTTVTIARRMGQE